jgi:hypothetical protein
MSRHVILASVVLPGLVLSIAAQQPPVLPGSLHRVGIGYAAGVAVGDVNGDGLPDAVVGKSYAATIAVLLGEGHGQFGPPIELPSHDDPVRPLLADFDGDGALDIVVGDGTGTRTSVHFGDGHGAFGPLVDLLAGPYPWSTLVRDLDGDGLLDVASAHKDGMVRIARSVSPGVVGPATALAVGGWLRDLAAADLDGDGVLDLVVGDWEGQRVVTLLGRGGVAYDPPVAVALPHSPDALAVTDLDGDGRPDVLSGGRSGTFGNYVGSVCYLANDGAGDLLAPVCWDQGESSPALSVGDILGDAVAEVVVFGHPQPLVFRGGPGGPTPLPGPAPVAVSGPDNIVLHDVDGDGLLDALYGWQDLVVALGRPTGRFDTQRQVAVAQPHDLLALGDVDGDGRQDLVATHTDSASMTVLLGNGLGGFGATPPLAAATGASGLRLGDVDDDGDDDIVVGFKNDSFPAYTRTWIYHSDGKGGFDTPIKKQVGGHPEMVDLADVDGDGDLDIVVPLLYGDAVSVQLGTGLGGFFPFVLYPAGDRPDFVTHGDLDGDGDDDLVTVSEWYPQFSVLLAEGSGGFAAPTSYATTPISSPQAAALGDLDEDGALDLVLSGSGKLGIAFGDGAGGFGLLATMSVSGEHSSGMLALVDMDDDGHLDLVSGGGAHVRRGDGLGGLLPPEDTLLPYDPRGAALGDLDGDGAPDLVVSSYNTLFVTTLIGRSGPGHDPWTDLGHSLAGAAGEPVLSPEGELAPGTPIALALSNAAPLAPTLLLAAIDGSPTPAFGGVLLAAPPLVGLPLAADAEGTASLDTTWPPGLPAGTRVVLQWLVEDSGAPAGVALSNAVEGVAP